MVQLLTKGIDEDIHMILVERSPICPAYADFITGKCRPVTKIEVLSQGALELHTIWKL